MHNLIMYVKVLRMRENMLHLYMQRFNFICYNGRVIIVSVVNGYNINFTSGEEN